MKTYRLTRQGRLLTLSLIAAVVLLWVFALLSLPGVLGLDIGDLRASFPAAMGDGLGVDEVIPAAILGAMLVAAPVVLAALIEEWSARYSITDDALLYQTLPGIALRAPWQAIGGLRLTESEEPVADVMVPPETLGAIRNPLLRTLHRWAIGAQRIPIYAGVEQRDELLAEIARRSADSQKSMDRQI